MKNMIEFEIVSLLKTDAGLIVACGEVLTEAFSENWNAWETAEEGVEEVEELLDENALFCVALTSDGDVLGFTAAQSTYDGFAWELHPLAVRPKYQGMGIG
ncbi:MAG: GNAT family N-acetyltransferase, partial [Candidatus Promineifilaceae bacterium]